MKKNEKKDTGKNMSVVIHKTPTEKELKEAEGIVEKVIGQEVIDAFANLTHGQVELIKRTVAVGATDDELKLFLQICKGAKLNPFMRQAHFVPFWDSKLGAERRAIIIGIDGYRNIAEDTGKYAGNDDATFKGEGFVEVDVWEGKGNTRKVTGKKKIKHPDEATVTVYKMVEGVRCAFSATARWSEYYPGGKKGGKWHDMPFLMLGKCAEALALRKAFPSRLGGTYTQEEMDRIISEPTPGQKTLSNINVIMKALEKAKSAKDVEDFKSKILKSEKYDETQKADIIEAADKRIVELTKEKTPAQKVDELAEDLKGEESK